jgi:hypothetical protein
MQQTLAQKIIARAAGLDSVCVGELVVGEVDLAMMQIPAGRDELLRCLLKSGKYLGSQ